MRRADLIDRYRSLRIAAGVVVAAVALLAGRDASAQDKVAIVDVAVDGVSEDARTRFEGNLEEGLRGAGFEVVPRQQVADALMDADIAGGCAFGPCVTKVGKLLGVPLVLVARVTADGPSYSYALTLVETVTGVSVSQVTDRCAVCTFDEALSSATLAVVELATQDRRVLGAPAAPRAIDGGRRSARKAAWWITVAAVVGAGAGVALLARDEDLAGWGALGAGGAFAVAGVTLFVVSVP